MNAAESPALTTALAFHRAWTSGDVDGAMEYLGEDFECEAPGQRIDGKGAYRDFLQGFSQTMTGLTDVAAFGDQQHVVLFYYPHTPATSTAPVAEHFTVSDGKIARTLMLFDRLSYMPPQSTQG